MDDHLLPQGYVLRFIELTLIERTREKGWRIPHLYCVRIHSDHAKPNTNELGGRTPIHSHSLRERERVDWDGGCEAEYTSVWKIWPSTTTESDESGKLCANVLKEMSTFEWQQWQHLRT